MTRVTKIKLLPRSTIKTKVKTGFAGSVAAGDGITVTHAAGVYTVSFVPDIGLFSPLTSAALAAIMSDETGSAGSGLLVFNNTPSFQNAASIISTDAGAAAAPNLSVYRNSASPAANDLIGYISHFGNNSVGAFKEYARSQGKILDPTVSSEDGQWSVQTMVAGTLADRLVVVQGAQLGSPTGGDKGAGTLNTAAAHYYNGVQLSAHASVVFEGDSMTNKDNLGTWPTYLRAQNAFFRRGNASYFATDGQTAADMVADYATEAGVVGVKPVSSVDEGYFFIWGGINDILDAAAAADIYDDLKAVWAAARADNYKVIAFTIPPSTSYDTTENAVRVALNALIRSDATLYDFLATPDVWFPNPSNTDMFVTGVHLTALGNSILAEKIAQLVGWPATHTVSSAGLAHANMAVNANHVISTVNGSAAVTTNIEVTNKHSLFRAGASTVSIQRVTDAPTGYEYSLKLTLTAEDASIAATDLIIVYEPIEGQRTAKLGFGVVKASPAVFGEWIKTNVAGTYYYSFQNSAQDRTYLHPVTLVADTWTWVSFVLPPDVTGTWLVGSSIGMYITRCMMGGSNYLGTANIWQAGNFKTASDHTNWAASLTGGTGSAAPTIQWTGTTLLPHTPGLEVLSSEIAPQLMRPTDIEMFLCGFVQNANPVTKTGTSSTVTAVQTSVIFNPSGTHTVTLPVASATPGHILRLRLIAAQAVNSASSNVVPRAGGAAGTAIFSGTAGQWCTLQSDGTNWEMMAGN